MKLRDVLETRNGTWQDTIDTGYDACRDTEAGLCQVCQKREWHFAAVLPACPAIMVCPICAVEAFAGEIGCWVISKPSENPESHIEAYNRIKAEKES